MLESVRILDLSHRLAGPFAGALLAGMGAHVIKVEPPQGDLTRESEPHVVPGVSEYFALANQAKDVVCLNLKHPAGREALLRLVRESDALLENFRPGVMERLGLDDDELRRANPRITHVGVSGHGATGPYRDRVSVDLLAQGLTGMMSLTGEVDGPPVPAGIAIADILGGLYAATALVSGILARERGRPAMPSADISLQQSLIHAMGLYTVRWLNGGPAPDRMAAETAYVAPYGRYETADGWIVVAARGEKYWREVATRAGLAALLEDPRFATNNDRVVHRDELNRVLAGTIRTRTTAAWLEIFDDLPVAAVNDVPAAFAHPQVEATGGVVELVGDGPGTLRVPRSAIRWVGDPLGLGLPGGLGSDTERILTMIAGYSAGQVRQMHADGAIDLGRDAPRAEEAAE